MSLGRIVQHLGRLVACDTQNPPRAIDGDSAVFRYCESLLANGFDLEKRDHGDGHVSLYALRGKPKVLFNVHLDTVPAGDGWETNPHELVTNGTRVHGLGACDIKGAAATLLTLAEQGVENLALLFTSDEEGGGGCCVSNFLRAGSHECFEQVVVAEPTGCRAILGHRGFLSVKTRFLGVPGHSSKASALEENANHQMARWASDALRLAESKKRSESDPGSCMNIGIVDGGTKSNVIAGSAFVHWSARLRPGESNEAFLAEVQGCAPEGADAEWEVPFAGESLPARGQGDGKAAAFCEGAGLERGEAVDFWTEASVFSAAGMPALVMGPGHIEQAHMANEWVEMKQLEHALGLYAQVVEHDR